MEWGRQWRGLFREPDYSLVLTAPSMEKLSALAVATEGALHRDRGQPER